MSILIREKLKQCIKTAIYKQLQTKKHDVQRKRLEEKLQEPYRLMVEKLLRKVERLTKLKNYFRDLSNFETIFALEIGLLISFSTI